MRTSSWDLIVLGIAWMIVGFIAVTIVMTVRQGQILYIFDYVFIVTSLTAPFISPVCSIILERRAERRQQIQEVIRRLQSGDPL